MRIYSINNTPQSFEARLKIKKGNVNDLLEKAESLAPASLGSVTGTASIASGLEQSHYYPNSLFPRGIYDSVIAESGGENGLVAKSVLELEDQMVGSPHYNDSCVGIPSGSGYSTTLSALGAKIQHLMSNMTDDVNKAGKEANKEKRIPS